MKKIYKINSNFFKNINNQKKAYWLGFITADGCISRKNRVRLRLITSKKDKEHFNKFLKTTKSNHKIYYNKHNTGYTVDISDNKIVDDLKKYNVVPRKTFILKMPKIDEDLIKHFIRGYFDGNGCFYIFLRKNRKLFSMNFAISSGTKSFLIDLQKILIKELKINKTKIRKTSGCYQINYGGNKQVKKIMDWLYCGSNVFLDRKYYKYKRYKKQYENYL
jgi:hypothetical protein